MTIGTRRDIILYVVDEVARYDVQQTSRGDGNSLFT